MKKLKENFLESPPRHPWQLIPMSKQIRVWTKLFIQNLNSLHSLFNWDSKNTSLTSKILKFTQQTFNTLNC